MPSVMAVWYVSLFLVTRNLIPTLMIRNMRSTQNINSCCGSAEPVPLSPVPLTPFFRNVPTQIMRDLIENDFSRAGIMGIKYRSVKNDGQPNVVLFLDNNTCGDCLELIDKEFIS